MVKARQPPPSLLGYEPFSGGCITTPYLLRRDARSARASIRQPTSFRVHAKLVRRGRQHSHNRVAWVMRASGLQGRRRSGGRGPPSPTRRPAQVRLRQTCRALGRSCGCGCGQRLPPSPAHRPPRLPAAHPKRCPAEQPNPLAQSSDVGRRRAVPFRPAVVK